MTAIRGKHGGIQMHPNERCGVTIGSVPTPEEVEEAFDRMVDVMSDIKARCVRCNEAFEVLKADTVDDIIVCPHCDRPANKEPEWRIAYVND